MTKMFFEESRKFAGKKLHLGVTGSVACYKAIELLRSFIHMEMSVTATLTDGARQFVTPLLFRSLGAEHVYEEMFADQSDVFGHLEPGQNVEAMAIVPASANTLAKLAQGFASDMLSTQALAFEGPIIIAPAMNPLMWRNKAVQDNVKILKERGCVFVLPGSGSMACGDQGVGRLAELQQIFYQILKALSPQDMQGLKVMVTLGPTREPWDGVRFISNPSSGRMGAAIATCAYLRGAEVTAICGPGVSIELPAEVNRVPVSTASEMFAAAEKVWPEMNWGVFSAAVSDFAPVRPANADQLKIKKTGSEPVKTIELKQNPDILATLAANRNNSQKILGFAAEIAPDSETLQSLAREKLMRKHADVVAANAVNNGAAFGEQESAMTVVDKNGVTESWQPLSKADIAWELCSWLLRI